MSIAYITQRSSITQKNLITHKNRSHSAADATKPASGSDVSFSDLPRKRKRRPRRKPLAGLTTADLRSLDALRERFDQAVAAGMIHGDLWLQFVAAAQNALRTAKDPPALFHWLIREKRFWGLPDCDTDTARQLIQPRRRTGGLVTIREALAGVVGTL